MGGTPRRRMPWFQWEFFFLLERPTSGDARAPRADVPPNLPCRSPMDTRWVVPLYVAKTQTRRDINYLRARGGLTFDRVTAC